MCETRTIARSGAFRVEACSTCSTLSIHVGPITLRLERDAVSTLHRVLGQALAKARLESDAGKAAALRSANALN